MCTSIHLTQMILDFGKYKGTAIEDVPVTYMIFLVGYTMHGNGTRRSTVYTTTLSTRHRLVDILSNWFGKVSLNYKAQSCFNRSRSRRFLQSTCLLLCSSGFAPTSPRTTFVCVRV